MRIDACQLLAGTTQLGEGARLQVLRSARRIARDIFRVSTSGGRFRSRTRLRLPTLVYVKK